MKKKTIIIALTFLTIIGVFGLYKANYYLEFIDFTSLSVKASDDLQSDKVNIKKGFFSINRKNDAELFDNLNKTITIFNGQKTGLIKTDYGENDFLITYDNKYYFQFRHFIFNSHDKYSYNYILSKKADTIYIQADIKGNGGMKFIRPMHLISDTNKLRCNAPIDNKKTIYNMTELEEH
jgi:hypothetical protein